MTRYIVAYFATMIVFFAIDYVWLGTIAKTFYRDQIGPLLLDEFKLHWAAGFYLLYGIGVVIFAVKPGLDSGSLLTALGFGALVGAMCYGTYDFTNLATLKGYTATVAFVDFFWGITLTSISAVSGAWITRMIMG
ncbi:MAG: DUF2177 family protein [Ahrensia sp.]|nr:DUF2177 family protein [Ahrensia sp.]